MYIEEIQRKYKEYFKDIDDRGYELLWTYFLYTPQNMYNSAHPSFINYSSTLIPSIDKIKTEYFEAFKNSDHDTYIQTSHLLVKNRLVPKKELEWIHANDNLLLSWLIRKIKDYPRITPSLIKIENKEIYNKIHPDKNPSPFITFPKNDYIAFNISESLTKQSNSNYENFIYDLDKLNISLDEKIIFLLTLKKEWFKNEEKYKLKKWLDKNDQKKLEWINEYINKKPPINMFRDEIVISANNVDLYESVLIKLGEPSFNSMDARELYIEKMKKSWFQKKFRDDGKTKKPHHLPLTKTTVTQLQKLARIKNMKEHQIIELLVDEAFHNEAMSNGKEIFE
ncbi:MULTISPECIES: hypothetical protein [Acinetobacter]|uniref:hypothetical protein n=1 Tax=Acinetobacter TaxID=469 RepID=UPI000C6C2211|nr:MULTISPECIES: hypothetical protein [unclassified Acinetobacter]MBC68853.1 hypothetical protein [Acinetobacter sp.]MBT48791.1 hypothetical protein [Acinetobacter sp.]|tara:strand:- start:686 stop:1699 length:1014 start_codon:yes stop_codon:yes gene_type:complete